MTLYIRRTSGVTLAVVPAAPAAPTLTPGSALLGVAFVAPGNDGGSAITSYDYRRSPAGAGTWTTVTGVTSPFNITGLTNGTSYDVQVRAVNAVGNGAWSASSTATPAAAGNLTVRSVSVSSSPYGTAMAVPAGAVAGDTLVFVASIGSDVSSNVIFAPALSTNVPGFATPGLAAGVTNFRAWYILSWDGTTTSYNFGDESWAGERIIYCMTGTASDVIGGQHRWIAGAGLAWTGYAMSTDDVALALAGTYDPADAVISSFDSSFTKVKDQGITEWCGLTPWYKRLTAGATVSPSPAGTCGNGNNSTQLIRVRP